AWSPRSAEGSIEPPQGRTTGRQARSSLRSKGGRRGRWEKTGTSSHEYEGLGSNTRPLSILASTSTRYKLPRLSEFPILPKQALKFVLYSHVVCLVEFTR